MSVTPYSEAGIVTPRQGGQLAFAKDWTNKMVALEGGWGAGKTFIGARKLLTLHVHNAFDLEGEATYVASASVAPTYGNAMDYVIPELFAACEEVGLSYNWHGNGAAIKGGFAGPAITIPDLGRKDKPSTILVRTADAPTRITGWQVGAGWGDEPARWAEDRFFPAKDSFLQLTGRVRDPKARFVQLMFTGTNEGDATRIYEEMHSGKPGRAWYRAKTIDNPSVRDFYDQQITSLTKELAEYYSIKDAKGVMVIEVFKGDPADAAGIRPKDIIIEVNGKPVKDHRELTNRIALIPVDSTAEIKVLRKDKLKTFQVKIAKREDDKLYARESEQKPHAELGMHVARLTPELSKRFGLQESAGLVVVRVEPDSKGSRAGIQAGDVIKEINHQPIKSEKDYQQALENVSEGEAINFFVLRRNMGFLVIKITK